MTKFCVDCKYYTIDAFHDKSRYEYHKCSHDIARSSFSVVTGKYLLIPCDIMRDDRSCGKEGKLWEKKDG